VGAVGSRKTILAETGAILADSMRVAIRRASKFVAVLASKSFIAHALEINASSTTSTFARALLHVTGLPSECSLALALAIDTNTIVVAVLCTCCLIAGSPGPSSLAIAGSIETMAIVAAVAGASIQGAIKTSPTSITCALGGLLIASTPSRASIGTFAARTVIPVESRVTVAHSINTESGVRAIIWAGLDRAISSTVLLGAITCSIEACSVVRAIVGARQL